MTTFVQYYGTGRRKTSVARVYLRPGSGQVIINKQPLEQYFGREVLRKIALQPLELTETGEQFDIYVNVHGGGLSGQAGAMRHGISRALLAAGLSMDGTEGSAAQVFIYRYKQTKNEQ